MTRRLVLRWLRTGLVAVLAGAMVALGPLTTTARAGMVGTEAVVNADAQPTRARIHGLLERQEARRELERLGVSADEAHARIDALSDAELAMIAGRLDQLPAGGSALGSILLTAVIIFIVLIITDALGITDVFPWVRNTSRR